MRTIQSRHEATHKWVKSPCKTTPLFPKTNNATCTGAPSDVGLYERHAEGPQVGRSAAWLAPTPAFSDRCHLRDSINGEPQTVILGCDIDI